MATAKEIQRDHKRLYDNLRLLQKLYGKDAICYETGIPQSTWTYRMREPWRLFSYDDFKAIARACKVDFITLVSGNLKVKGE